MTIDDVLDLNKPVPSDSPFAQSVNEMKKNLVTIEQTSV
jgi:hypothetical protein